MGDQSQQQAKEKEKQVGRQGRKKLGMSPVPPSAEDSRKKQQPNPKDKGTAPIATENFDDKYTPPTLQERYNRMVSPDTPGTSAGGAQLQLLQGQLDPEDFALQYIKLLMDNAININEEMFKKFQQQMQKETAHLSQAQAHHVYNEKYNTDKEHVPYDFNRVVLEKVPETDYINASEIAFEGIPRKYILAAGPSRVTRSYFWHMVWQRNVKCILNLFESHQHSEKYCWPYYPDTGVTPTNANRTVRCPDANLEILDACPHGERVLRLTKKGHGNWETRTVRVLQFYGWGYLSTIEEKSVRLVQFLTKARPYLEDSEQHPVVIHDSISGGRSSALILVDACLEAFRRRMPIDNLEPQSMLKLLRQQRRTAVNRLKKLEVVYASILVQLKAELGLHD